MVKMTLMILPSTFEQPPVPNFNEVVQITLFISQFVLSFRCPVGPDNLNFKRSRGAILVAIMIQAE